MKIKYLMGLMLLIWLSTPTKAQSIFEQWTELDSFHEVMSATFHPSEEGNLAPIKSRSGEMAQKAATLAKNTIPTQFATPAIQTAVKKLQKDSKALHKLIKSQKATDEQVTQSLSALHDVFHEIVGLCREGNH